MINVNYFEERGEILRFVLHAITWIILWEIIRYFSIPTLTRDNEDVVLHASVVVMLQSIVIFYLLGYLIFPKFLYQKKIIALVVCVAGLCQMMHIVNYYEFAYLFTISAGKKTSPLYIQRVWSNFFAIQRWTSCFTDFTMAYLNYAWSFFYVTPILAVKVLRDIIKSRTHNLRLERDRLRLERDNLDLKSNSLQLQKDNLVLEVSYLKSQINPHFLFNILNAIYTRTSDADPTAADIVIKLAGLMRYSLYRSNGDRVNLTDEIEYIENYMNLEKLRFGDALEVNLNVEGELGDFTIAPLLLISFVENAYKHGTYKTSNPSFVCVYINLIGPQLKFSVVNSYEEKAGGRQNRRKAERDSGFGLENVRKRLAILYHGRHSLVVSKQKNQFEIILEISLDNTLNDIV